MDRLFELPSCTLVATGRTGTDFMHSLLDSHPEVLTFNGNLKFHSFWKRSICVAAGEYDTRDLIDEFIGTYIHLFKSRYDLIERKHQLGENLDQSIDIDLDRFRSEAATLLEGRETTSKNALIAIYGAYSLCIGQRLEEKKLFFHHVHHFDELPSYLADFPESRIICMTRDPRANFVSGVEHHRDNNRFEDMDHGAHLIFTINRILDDAAPLGKFGNDYRVLRIEDLGRQEILQELCRWLEISYDECLTRSTWGGISWHSDAISKVNQSVGWSKEVLDNRWASKLGRKDKYILNYIMLPRLKHYQYSYKRIHLWDPLAVPVLILLPLSYELRFFSYRYLARRLRRGDARTIVKNFLSYVKRVALFYKFYFRVTTGRKFNHPLLAAE